MTTNDYDALDRHAKPIFRWVFAATGVTLLMLALAVVAMFAGNNGLAEAFGYGTVIGGGGIALATGGAVGFRAGYLAACREARGR